jgi:TIGR03009 family protein
MRFLVSSVIGLGTLAILLAPQGAAQPQQESVDTVLRGWEKAMTDIKSFAAVVERDTLDKALQAKDQFKGYAMFRKPTVKDDSSRALLQLTKATSADIFEKYVCTGTYLYEYAATNKLVRVHDMPKTKDGVQQESFLSFLFGMGAAQAKERYDMELVYPPGGKPDANYHYLRVKPKLDQDKGDFIEARLSLYRSNHLPAQIWYLQPNRNEITWNFSKLQVDVDIPLTYFEPSVPKGWEMKRIQPKTPAGVTPTIRK